MRPAVGDDIPHVTDMIEALTKAVKGPLAVDRAWVGAQLARLIASDDGCVLVTRAGFIAGSVQPTLINVALIAIEHGWWAADGMGVRLLRGYERWASAKGAVAVHLSGMAGGVDLGRLGYRAAEQAWVRMI
jgi:hypothetical protein